jgi:hypothetical protein
MLHNLFDPVLVDDNLAVGKTLGLDNLPTGTALGAMGELALQGTNFGTELVAAARSRSRSGSKDHGASRLATAATMSGVRIPA